MTYKQNEVSYPQGVIIYFISLKLIRFNFVSTFLECFLAMENPRKKGRGFKEGILI